MVFAESVFAFFAVYEDIVEIVGMAGGLPDRGMHQNAAIQTYHVVPLMHYGFPPGSFEVALKLHPQGAIIPGTGQSTVNFR